MIIQFINLDLHILIIWTWWSIALKEMRIKQRYISLSTTFCNEDCEYTEVASLFNLDIYNKLSDLDNYNSENSLEEYINNTFKPMSKEESLEKINLRDSTPAYRLNLIKKLGNPSRLTQIYIEKKGKIYVINGYYPHISSVLMNTSFDFDTVLNSFEFYD